METAQPTPKSPNRRRRGLWLVLLLAVLGLAVSIQLLVIHVTVEKDPTHPFSCRVSETVDCNAVALSPESAFFDVPVPVWAILTYVLFGGMALAGLFGKSAPLDRAGDYALPLAAWSVGYSAYLAYVAFFRIETFCAFCAALYFVNLGLLPASLQASSPLRGWPGRRFDDAKWLRTSPSALFVLGTVILLLAAGAAYQVLAEGESTVELVTGGKLDISKDPKLGTEGAPITIVEFSDFECPFCVMMHFRNQKLMAEFRGKILLAQKAYPLDASCNPHVSRSIHPYSCQAAYAAECAYRLGKYESYADKLWSASHDGAVLGRPLLLELAGQEGLDPDAFGACMDEKSVHDAVSADIEAGEAVGLEATPTFIVNGYKFTGSRDLKWSVRLIKRMLAGKKPRTSKKP